ncbi:MAG: SDR family NAD(P)-dependent oxidoreductase [Actinomycetota bacterium]|nr:SDR family NAD(P)-dependent oxidoreductase [Actinomycetota bacterium]
MELSGRVGIVTGASRGLGILFAEELASRGMDLALAARSKDDLEETAERVRARGRRALPVPTDVGDPAQLEELVAATEREFGVVDLLVNNAGVELTGYSDRLELEDIERAVHINLTSLIQLTRLVIPGMIERRRGHVCNIASTAGKVARPYATVYAATKHAVIGFSWSLRAEIAEKGVEVSVVCPHYVSDVGMFADRKTRYGTPSPPRSIGEVSAHDVAVAAVEGIERNRAETVVAPPMVQIADLAHAFSPDLAMALARRTGAFDFVKREATGESS